MLTTIAIGASVLQAEAQYTPTPGWILVENDLTSTANGCEGSSEFRYRMVSADTAFALRGRILSNCSIEIGFVDLGDPVSTVGGAFIAGDIVDGRSHYYSNVIGVAWDALSACPSITYENATTSHENGIQANWLNSKSYTPHEFAAGSYCARWRNATWDNFVPTTQFTPPNGYSKIDAIKAGADSSNVVECKATEIVYSNVEVADDPLAVFCELKASATSDPSWDIPDSTWDTLDIVIAGGTLTLKLPGRL